MVGLNGPFVFLWAAAACGGLGALPARANAAVVVQQEQDGTI
jgi:hypothetical protein